jgi:hypothetical protein
MYAERLDSAQAFDEHMANKIVVSGQVACVHGSVAVFPFDLSNTAFLFFFLVFLFIRMTAGIVAILRRTRMVSIALSLINRVCTFLTVSQIAVSAIRGARMGFGRALRAATRCS